MNRLSPTRLAQILVMASGLSIVAAGCGSGDTPVAAPQPEAAATQVVVEDVPESAEEATVVPTEVPTEAPAPGPERYLPELSLADADPGPRPLLSWTGVEGAVRYTLVILGADGIPYWAWSGTDTAIHVGGFENPDAVGPWVHEPMTWTVAATDADGTPIALSEPGVLTP